MSTCPQQYIDYMHEYLDGDISRDHEQALKKHLQACEPCKQHMHELGDTIAFVKSAAQITTPPSFEAQIMSSLPKRSNTVSIQKWFRGHPVLVAAAVFCILMSAALVGSFSSNTQFSVSNQANVIVDGKTVIVPEGQTVKGDIVVRNGDIRVEGEVEGNVTVINGKYMASSAVVTGEIAEIDQAFEWLWYKIKHTFNK
jgi:anti-sigma factor RsiW